MTSSQARPTRFRLTFRKMDGIRFTGTLDLQRSLERTIRRARLPLAYTQGFNPRPRLSLGAALPLGLTSDCELADIWLEADRDHGGILEGLRLASPPGLEFLDLTVVPDNGPSLQQQIVAAEYLAEIEPGLDLREVEDRVESLLMLETVLRERRGKPYDLRPLVEALEVVSSEPTRTALHMRLTAREGATGRPDEVLLALELDPSAVRIRRTRLILSLPTHAEEPRLL